MPQKIFKMEQMDGPMDQQTEGQGSKIGFLFDT